MQTLNAALIEHVVAGRVDQEVAANAAPRIMIFTPSSLDRALREHRAPAGAGGTAGGRRRGSRRRSVRPERARRPCCEWPHCRGCLGARPCGRQLPEMSSPPASAASVDRLAGLWCFLSCGTSGLRGTTTSRSSRSCAAWAMSPLRRVDLLALSGPVEAAGPAWSRPARTQVRLLLGLPQRPTCAVLARDLGDLTVARRIIPTGSSCPPPSFCSLRTPCSTRRSSGSRPGSRPRSS